MYFKSLLIFAVTLLLELIPNAFAASVNDPCALPQDLEPVISHKYADARVVTSSDLEEDDRRFFEADHYDACPGLIKVDFYGDAQPTLAVVLLLRRAADKKEQTELIVAHQVGKAWNLAELGSGGADSLVPVVWSQPPGIYQDVYSAKTIRAIRPVIVFCKYEAWAILYAWNGKRVSKIWIMD